LQKRERLREGRTRAICSGAITDCRTCAMKMICVLSRRRNRMFSSAKRRTRSTRHWARLDTTHLTATSKSVSTPDLTAKSGRKMIADQVSGMGQKHASAQGLRYVRSIPESRHSSGTPAWSQKCQVRTHAPQQNGIINRSDRRRRRRCDCFLSASYVASHKPLTPH
jgi:hypothetical protein